MSGQYFQLQMAFRVRKYIKACFSEKRLPGQFCSTFIQKS